MRFPLIMVADDGTLVLSRATLTSTPHVPGSCSKMEIGLKLDIGFSDDQACRRLYGDGDIAAYLRELGFAAAETALGPETDAQALKDHVARCVNAGLKLSFHPYSEGTIFSPASFSAQPDDLCRRLHQHFFSLAAEAARQQQSPALVNLHAAAGPAGQPRRVLVKRSIAFFAWARDWCRRHAPEVHLLAELQISPDPHEPWLRIGDTYGELLKIVKRSHIRACWDFGHAYLNSQRYDEPLYPPDALLKRIGHVHCHDALGSDHQPLIYNNVPWKSYLRALIDTGFKGRIILEVTPWSFLRAGGLQALTDSLRALQGWTRRCESDVQERR